MVKVWVPQESGEITISEGGYTIVSGVVTDHIIEVEDGGPVAWLLRHVEGARADGTPPPSMEDANKPPFSSQVKAPKPGDNQ